MQKYRDRNGRCIAILFRSIRVKGRWNTPDILGALQRQVVLQGAFVKIRDFIKFKGFSCGIPGEQALLRKSKGGAFFAAHIGTLVGFAGPPGWHS